MLLVICFYQTSMLLLVIMLNDKKEKWYEEITWSDLD
jgi:hypothetical protein